MAHTGGGALSAEAPRSDTQDDTPLDLHRGRGWLAAVHPAWHAALGEAGWLQCAPLDAGCAAEPFESGVGGGRGGVLRVRLAPAAIVVRPVRRGGWLGPVLGTRLLAPTRPLAEARATETLRRRGAPVPLLVLALAWRRGRLGWEAVVATREEPGARNGRVWLETHGRSAARRRAAEAAGRAIRRFHDAGGRHRDLHLGNLLVADGAEGPSVRVIDLDGARVGALPSARRRMRELMRLYRSLLKADIPDRRRLAAAALHGYCAGERELRGALLRWRGVEALRVAVHRLAYPS